MDNKLENNKIELSYPNELPVYIAGLNRYDDLKSLLLQGQGVGGASNLLQILIDETNMWDHILSIIKYKIKDLKDIEELPIQVAKDFIIPGKYLVIYKDNKLGIANLKKTEIGFEWDHEDVAIVFPRANAIKSLDVIFESGIDYRL